MRNAFAAEVTKLGAEDARVVLMSGDIGNRLFDDFKVRSPGRFFNCGVAEANMMGMAAGLGLSGMRPVVYTITPFLTTRCYEQVRNDVCYHKSPVIIVGTGSGLSYAELGPTHHSCEDMALMRLLPDMTVLAPCDQVELRLGLRAALQKSGPVYIRIGKKGEPTIHKSDPDFAIGRAITLRQGSDLCLIGTGTIVPVVLGAADQLTANNLSVRVESFPTVKPLDTARLNELFSAYPVVAVAEEHSRAGGLGSSVAEWLATQPKSSARLISFGTDDVFLHEVGSQTYARERFGLTADNIARTVRAAVTAQ